MRWSHRLWGQDDWNVACLVGFASGQGNCPDPQGPDFDFASGVNMFVVKNGRSLRTVLGAGQKSGTLLRARSGYRQAAVGDQRGTGLCPRRHRVGLGDGRRTHLRRHRESVRYSSTAQETRARGARSTLSPARCCGEHPIRTEPWRSGLWPLRTASSIAPSMAGAPDARNMLALDARTGETLWSFAAGGSVAAGAIDRERHDLLGFGLYEPRHARHDR